MLMERRFRINRLFRSGSLFPEGKFHTARAARLTTVIAFIGGVFSTLSLITNYIVEADLMVNVATAILAGSFIIAFYLARVQNSYLTATFLMCVSLILSLGAMYSANNGIDGPIPFSFMIVILIVGVLLPRKWAWVMSLLAITILMLLILAETMGIIQPQIYHTKFNKVLDITSTILFVFLSMLVVLRSLWNASNEVEGEIEKAGKRKVKMVENSYLDLIASTPIGIARCNSYGVIVEANVLFSTIINIPLYEVIDKPLKTLLPIELKMPETSPNINVTPQPVLNAVSQGEFKIDEKRDEPIHVRYSTLVLPMVEQIPLGFLLLIWDITEQKKLQDALQRHTEHLEDLVKDRTERIRELERQQAAAERLAALGEMVAGIAHEINNPLATVKNCMHLIGPAIGKEPTYNKYIDVMSREINRIATIISQMFILFRPASQKATITDVHQFIDDILLSYQGRISSNNIAISDRRQIEPLNLVLPPAYITQILYNVVSNAIDSMPGGGTLEIESGNQNGCAFIRIGDTGMGMEKDVMEHMFDPFFTTKRGKGDKSGMGLGLSVTRSLADALSIRIDVDSAVGKGSSFTLVFPKNPVFDA